ncbi:hypothetical protein K9B32_21750 [Rhizobium sp. 3T7]|uniref:hypothetical protein n=1 Tax=Rhizobium sp. 3T7 TaxID=2874922 RepID=UPI001CD00CA5|nr:hypothetical protein [Rhizobium sp. 3T7]MBZ9792700.1 hypothetical protein [Rhizobium sp. 3T7]
MRKIASLVALAFVVAPVTSEARDEIAGPVSAEILRVIDGDTLLVEARALGHSERWKSMFEFAASMRRRCTPNALK